jgi:hypothetical protein
MSKSKSIKIFPLKVPLLAGANKLPLKNAIRIFPEPTKKMHGIFRLSWKQPIGFRSPHGKKRNSKFFNAIHFDQIYILEISFLIHFG